ncbi:hypothetical protein FH972_001907 [Carpinus fangiana]|uniref:Small ribosomal subunit protein uS15c n=1 Tax=Carpinus fangiana TaxID=176857 RepID=A0A5N6QF28_9ROSI|nr:hypothetical protein FH972_001907 [Carpinus fangiana]
MAALQLRPKHRTLHNPSLVNLFSTSPTPPDPTPADQSPSSTSTSPHPAQSQSQSQPSFSSYFSDVKASLKQRQQQGQRRPTNPLSPSLSKPSKVASLEEIRKNLSEFRLRSTVPPPTEPNSSSSTLSSSQHISFQELYKRSVAANADENSANAESDPGKVGGRLSFEAIRESMRQLRSSSSPGTAQNEGRSAHPMSLSEYKNSFNLKPSTESGPVIGGTGMLPASVFGKERERKGSKGETMATNTNFVRMYTFEQLGKKLRELRPEGKKEKEASFSLGELNERLIKLREMEEKETESKISGVKMKDLRESLMTLQMTDDENAKKNSFQRLDILGQLGRTPTFLLQPPKEQLVEKASILLFYFHPDNMSSTEKLKIELAKVRDEFKMSESDCGSARVQVAQLTTKIKHLSTVLHKKDKHSRKGLIGMVQRRKRLLKYLRRTDWDSYCLVLSKLGLRDNPNYKH